MGVTIRDVAEASGVSLMAVSKVLHGRGASVRVGEKTAEHIRRIAEELGYRPNALARSLRLGKTDNIGLIFQGFENLKQGYYVELLHGIMSTSFNSGYSLTICPKLMNPSSPEVLNDGRFDGVIWSKMVDNPDLIKALESSRIPIVVLHVPAAVGLKDVTTLCCDNDQGFDMAVQHLYDLGHRRIVFAYEHIHEGLVETHARKNAFLSAMKRRNLPAGDDAVVRWHVTADEFVEWWDSSPPHTAIVTRGEWFAGQILERAKEKGASIPEQLSLVCFDSTEFSKSRHPRLTAIRQPIYDMAVKATEILLKQIDEKTKIVETLLFPCSLDVRESTAAPRDRPL